MSGGNGGGNPGGNGGGAGGVSYSTGTGGSGAAGSYSGGGGGGGGGLNGGNGAAGNNMSGGTAGSAGAGGTYGGSKSAGGAGGNGSAGGGGGGGGATFGEVPQSGTLSGAAIAGQVAGGNGGNSTGNYGGGGGGGGAGGNLLALTGTGITVTLRTATGFFGGVGGAGGNVTGGTIDTGYGGSGGGGGHAIYAGNGNTVVNGGYIIGGRGGAGGTNTYSSSRDGAAGAGGAAIAGSNLTIVNTGTISGGVSGDGAMQADAIDFTSGSNALTLGGVISGGIGISGALDLATVRDTTLAAAIHDGANGNGLLLYESDNVLTLAGASSYSGGTQIGSGAIVLDHTSGTFFDAAGTGAIDIVDGATLGLSISGTLANDVDFLSGTGTLEAAAGTTTTLTGNFGNNGASTIVFGSTADTGTIILASSRRTVYGSGASLVEIAGGTLEDGGTFGLAFPAQTSGGSSGPTLQIDAGATLDLDTFDDEIDGLTGTGTLTNAAGGTATIDGGTFAGTIAGTGVVAFKGATTLSGVSTNSGATIVDAGVTLTLAEGGATSATSAITDDGTIKLSGDTLAGASLTEDGGSSGVVSGTGTVSANITSSGLAFASSGGALTFTGTDTFGGTLSGTKAIFSAGTDTFASGSTLSVSTLAIDGATVNIAVGRTFRGALDLDAGTLSLGRVNFNVSGAIEFGGGTITGTGNFGAYGTTKLDKGTAVTGSAVLTDAALLTATASLSLQTSADLTVTSKGIYDLDGNVSIGARTANDKITNQGFIEKTAGSGKSSITAAIANTGKIEAASGLLDLTGAISGTGTLDIEGSATMELAGVIAAAQTMQFGSGNDTLQLDNAKSFRATLAGFGVGDSIALTGFDAKAHLTYTAAAGGGGTLKVSDGSAGYFSTHVDGTYNASGFSLTHTSSGDTIHYAASKA